LLGDSPNDFISIVTNSPCPTPEGGGITSLIDESDAHQGEHYVWGVQHIPEGDVVKALPWGRHLRSPSPTAQKVNWAADHVPHTIWMATSTSTT